MTFASPNAWRSARGLPQVIPSTFTQPRKENMAQKYTDQQLKDALFEAAYARQDIEIYSHGIDRDTTEPDYWTASELNDLRAILDNLPKTDDELTPCTHDEIQKGDTVEWTRKDRDLTRVVTGIAHTKDYGAWYTACGEVLAPSNRGGTYRRKPAPVVHPNPEEHPYVLDNDDDLWVWSKLRQHYVEPNTGVTGSASGFYDGWKPAEIVAKVNADE